MALTQSQWGKGRKQTPTPHMAGSVHNVLFFYDLVAGRDAPVAGAADKIEMGVLPGGARVTDMKMFGVTGGAATGTVGLMSGAPLDPDPARTVGTEYFAATAIDALNTMSQLAGYNIPVSDQDRSIGMTISAAIAAGAGRYIAISMSYVI